MDVNVDRLVTLGRY